MFAFEKDAYRVSSAFCPFSLNPGRLSAEVSALLGAVCWDLQSLCLYFSAMRD